MDKEDPRYYKGISLFNRGSYFEAHEVWEELWHAIFGEPRNYIQGLIQVTSALHHFHNGNLRGARILHDSGKELLAPYPDLYMGVDLKKVRKDFDQACEGFLTAPLEQLSGRGHPGPIKVPFTPERAFRIELL